MEKLTAEERRKLERIIAELRSYQATADLLRQHLDALTASASELTTTAETLKALKELKPDAEVLVPIGSDSYIPARLPPLERVIIGLGAEVSAERRVEEATRMLEQRLSEVSQAMEQTRAELEKLGERIDALRPEAERLLAKIQKQGA